MTLEHITKPESKVKQCPNIHDAYMWKGHRIQLMQNDQIKAIHNSVFVNHNPSLVLGNVQTIQSINAVRLLDRRIEKIPSTTRASQHSLMFVPLSPFLTTNEHYFQLYELKRHMRICNAFFSGLFHSKQYVLVL